MPQKTQATLRPENCKVWNETTKLISSNNRILRTSQDLLDWVSYEGGSSAFVKDSSVVTTDSEDVSKEVRVARPGV